MKMWVPETLREEVLRQAHDSVTSSHAGMQKTITKIRRNLFWPGLSKDVRDYIRSCDACKENRAPNYTLCPQMGEDCPTYRPFQRLYIDLLDPHPLSKQGHVGLLIVLDHFSKYPWLQPLKKFTSAAIIEFVLKQVFHSVGVHETLGSDNGTQFKASEFNAFITELGINHVYTALYSPQSNSYLKNYQTEWDMPCKSRSRKTAVCGN